MSTSDRVTVRIYYNGKFPRTHTISREFLARLRAFCDKHPKFDCVIEEL